jgi:hypothetical protein
MLIWGTGGKNLDLGQVLTQHCDTCEKSRDYHLMLHYRYFHLYWFMTVVTKREYFVLCNVCSHGWSIPAAEAKKLLPQGKSPIPFWTEYGLLATFGTLMGLGMLSAIVQSIGVALGAK